MNPTFKDLFNLYNDNFKPAYADLVGYIGDKPFDVLVELENALSHIFVVFDPDAPVEIKKENLEKAYNHILRTTLDCYKLLWVYLDEDIEKISKSEVGALALTISEEEFLHLRTQFKNKAMEARKKEMMEIGKDPLQAVSDYREVAEIGMKIMDSVDDNKQKKAQMFRLRSKWWELLMGFLLGVGSGIIADVFYSHIFR